ncbi:MAG: M15 family metallopeptidase [Spirochaetes bacterium]|nr:M15 family metallopeptidase [Spirochaetota bacterium]
MKRESELERAAAYVRNLRLIKIGAWLLAIFAAGFLAGCAGMRARRLPPPPYEPRTASTLGILDNLEAQEEIMLAFARAHPGKIGGVAFVDGDWSMLVMDTRFFFANGRFLPEDLRDYWQDFYPWDFYPYPFTGSPGLRRVLLDNPVFSVGSSFLFDTLYSSLTREASREMQTVHSFLGIELVVHTYIVPVLERVAQRISEAALTDASIGEWLEDILDGGSAYAWSWRPIAGTNRRSNHSYGIAIDFLPSDLAGRHTFWGWTRYYGPVSRETHYLPPDAVIEAFGHYGFLWGGHWSMFDTMHFEYRPELLILNNVPFERVDR